MTETSLQPQISVSITEGVCSVVIDNPSQRNALTKSMCVELQILMPKLDSDPRVSIITLRGAGNAFSAGATINDLSSVLLDRQSDGSLVDQLSLADQAIADVTKPTIALVDGPCMGGGWQIASACDFIIASTRSTFAITPAKIGIIYPRAGIERLVRQAGPANAKFILFTGEPFTATEAKDFGLVAEVVHDDEFEDRCTSLIRTIQSRSRFSTHSMKRLVDLKTGTDQLFEKEWDDAWAAMLESPDMKIGISAFLKRESPQFAWEPQPMPLWHSTQGPT
ncbi:enoyl-CoA hydratase/isomerase family protein [Arthrobacter psychrochitiniphilus]|uniref:enoyl-CoA hydratase/isomerase family protein n=1 Tax=Arthrobacter psychrochitiniphilus TaxID=291045 RepID=UPI003F7C386D